MMQCYKNRNKDKFEMCHQLQESFTNGGDIEDET